MLHRSAAVVGFVLALSGCVISPVDGIATIRTTISGAATSAPGAPVIDALDATPKTVGPNDVVTFTAVAHDPAGKPLQFNWSATGGVLTSNTGKVVSWTPQGAKGVVTVSLVVSNGQDATTGSVNLMLGPDGSATVTSTPAPAASPLPLPSPSVLASAPPSAPPSAAPYCVARVNPMIAAPGTIFYLQGVGLAAVKQLTLDEQRRPVEIVQQSDNAIAAKIPADLPVGKHTVWLEGCNLANSIIVANTQDFGGNVQQAGQGLFANVYKIPEDSQKLPDLGALKPYSSLLVKDLDVPDHDFSQGFPGVDGNLVEWFAIRFEGQLETPAGATRFNISSDDGAKLYIDDQLVVDNDGVHAEASQDGTATLTAGKHKFRLDYFQGPRYRIALQLRWAPPGASEAVIVPASAFSQGAFK